jgi:Tat protein secretion system quality control protein TatD with DNase activity
LNTDLLSATSKLILLSEQKCGQQIVSECQKILPLSLLACTQTLEKSETVVTLQKTVERLVAHCGIQPSVNETVSESEGEEIKESNAGGGKKKRKKNNR